MKKQNMKISMLAAPIMIVSALLASGTPAMAEPADGPCSNRTLSGDYGFAIEGMVLAIPGVTLPPGAALPLRGVAMTHFDGKGNLTQVDHVLVNGTPPPEQWTMGSGTYQVNPDCTGTAVINIPGNPLSPAKLYLVVVKQGKEIHTVVNANAVTSVGVKIE
jgi:hypothetical protein